MSMVAEKVIVTKTGVSFVPTKEDLNKIRFLVPNSEKVISIEKQRAPRKPPTHIQFGMLSHRHLRMVRAIPLQIKRKGKTVVATWHEIEEFGYGNNISEALTDFGKTVEE